MMRTCLRAAAGLALALAAAAAGAAPAGAVTVTVVNGGGLAGQTVDVAISSGTLTGLNVRSLQFDLSYNNGVAVATDVIETGALTGAAGWTPAAFHVVTSGGTDRLTVSAAGTTALSGSGTLLFVRFQLNPALLAGSSTALTLANVVFDEGSPAATGVSGTLTVNPTPQITVSPDNGTIVRGGTLAFNVSGSVSNPVTWSTTDNTVATISSAGVLTGVAPGHVRVFAVDNGGHRDTTNADILVRGMSVTAGTVSVLAGQPILVPLTVSTLSGLGVRAGQITLTFNASVLTATGVITPSGTLLHGYGPAGFGAGAGTCSVDFAGGSDLTGGGILCYVSFTAPATGASTIAVASAVFNETLPALPVNGTVFVNALPLISVSPDQVTLLAGQQQAFSVLGSPTAPIAWSVLDPTVAGINGAGTLTALRGGDTQVRAQDAVGAVDLNTGVHVYDFQAALGPVTGPPGSTVRVPLLLDRTIGTLGVMAFQYGVSWTGSAIVHARATPGGLANLWGPGGVLGVASGSGITVAAAGTRALDASGLELTELEFDLAPGAPLGTDVPLTLSGLLFNEGHPRALTANGVIHVRATTDVPPAGAAALALAPCEPNPLRGGGLIRFTLPAGDGAADAPVRLALYAPDGRRVRTLFDGRLPPGAHEFTWSADDDAGRRVAPGLYFCRLDCPAGSRVRKLAVTR